MDNYLQLLEESLLKKSDVLERIEVCNKEQEAILQEPEVSLERFDESIDAKGSLIEELNALDAGFEQLYERIRVQLLDNRDKYKGQIEALQKLISVVTGKSVSIQAQELRNKRLVEDYFTRAKQELRSGRIGSKAAMDYYKNMSRSDYTSPQYMDQKK